MSTHILYHANCADGAAAAAVALMTAPLAELHPVQYGWPVPKLPADANVIIVDFSYKRAVLEELRARVKNLLVIDHHATAKRELTGLDYCIFDGYESGATLAWNHFFPRKFMPVILKYIRDRDLWEWKMPHSREFSAGWRLDSWDDPDTIAGYLSANLDNHMIDKAIDNGTPIVQYQDACIASDIKKSKQFDLLEHSVPVLNCTHSAIISETCGALAKGELFAATYFDTSRLRIYSLRSSEGEPQALNVSKIAARFGGGGHKHAAGFAVPLRRLVPYVSPFPLTETDAQI